MSSKRWQGIADDLRGLAVHANEMAQVVDGFGKTDAKKQSAFLLAAVAVAQDGYQPTQKTLKALRDAYTALTHTHGPT